MGLTKYTPAPGTIGLRKAICEKLLRDNGLAYTPEQIVVSNGAKFSIYASLAAIVNPGDEVIIPTPCWVSYPEIVRIVGGVSVLIEGKAERGFVVDAEEIAPYVTEKTKALILNSPNNPNGCVWKREQLEAIAKLAVEKGFYVVSDEIYEKLIYDGEEHVSIASLGEEIYKQTIVINGVSKSYAMTRMAHRLHGGSPERDQGDEQPAKPGRQRQQLHRAVCRGGSAPFPEGRGGN